MNAKSLDAIIAQHDLNEHPFYRAWREGKLPRAKLAEYACEYAPFIDSIELGWRSVGCVDHAEVERRHARLWNEFRDALGPSALAPTACPQAKHLFDEVGRSFADPVEALGALYAFESQQPSTARSKLDALREHAAVYGVPEDKRAYFRVHADDYGEREQLRGLVEKLRPDDGVRAAAACERACKAMWSALSGILGESDCATSPAT